MKTLRKMRVDVKLSQAEVAKKLAVSVRTISNWEKAIAVPSLVDAVQLALLYRVSLEDIVSGCGIPMRGLKMVNEVKVN